MTRRGDWNGDGDAKESEVAKYTRMAIRCLPLRSALRLCCQGDRLSSKVVTG